MRIKKYLFYISQNYSFAILRPVQKVILERGDKIAWFVQGNSVDTDYFDTNENVLKNVDEIFKYDPDAVLYPANIAPTFFPGINVAIFHGFDAGKLDKKGRNDHYKIRNCFDLYCTQGPDSTREFERLAIQNKSFNVIETGWCALDPLFESHNVNIDQTKSTVLMCSTFSKQLTCAPHIFETVKRLSATGKWNWLVQFHPKMDKDIVEQYKSIQNEHLQFIETADVIPLLKKADVMVCDTSSVLIMFLLQAKPVVTFKNIAPENYLININDPDKLEQSITLALQKPVELMQNIQRFIDDTHPYQDGKSSNRVLDAIDITLTEKSKLKAKRLDIIRQFKMRKKLRYWKFW